MRRSLLVVSMLLACRAKRDDDPRGGSASNRPTAPPAGPIGSPHPIHVIKSAASGRWIVACQARLDTDGVPGIRVHRLEHGFNGDKLTPYLIRGGGDGIAIDGFVEASHDDRWLAVVRDGALVLIDDASGREHVLAGADVRGEIATGRQIAAFDADSTHMVYATLVNGQSRLAIRELASQAERVPSAPPGIVWQVRGQPPSAWLRVTYLRRAVRPNEFPHLVTSSAAGSQCRIDMLAAFDFAPDPLANVWLHSGTGELRDAQPVPDRVHDTAETRPAIPASEEDVVSSVDHVYRIKNVRTGAVTELPGVKGPIGQQSGGVIAIGRTIVDLAAARVLGEVRFRPLAVEAGGRALVPAEDPAADVDDLERELPIGPLRWVSPTPVAGESRTL